MCNNNLIEIEKRLIEIEKRILKTNQKAELNDLNIEKEVLINLLKGD